MSVAAVTPRVRTIVICDDVTESLTEDGVYTLEGVRSHLAAAVLPCRVSLTLYLLFSSPRRGKYSGKILVVQEGTEKPIRYVKFSVTFEEDNEVLSYWIAVDNCVFHEAGPYLFQVYFANKDGDEALKAEHPFTVLSIE